MNDASIAQDLPFIARPVTALIGVGAERASQLARLGIETIEDLILHRPRRYEDRRHLKAISVIERGESAVTHGRVVACGVKWFAKHTKSIFELILDDGSARLHCRWWNMPYLEKQFSTGDELVVFGKVLQLKPRTMDHPETEVIQTGDEEFLHLGRITPVYPLTQGMTQRWLRGLIWRTVQAALQHLTEPWSPKLLQAPIQGLPTRLQAIRMLHFPESETEPLQARRRLALDEFVSLQYGIKSRRAEFFRKVQSLRCPGDNRFTRPFLARLGFKLTPAQTRVLREVRKDMSGPVPMRRLLQGDVGSGKTVIAACSALMAIETGFTVAIMAPTEILAEQHFRNFNTWFRPLGIPVQLLTGSRKIRLDGVETARSTGALVVGTHALLSQGVEFPNLGLVVIDEQHRFGVAQRENLVRKGAYPHLLVMTATPIPRTLGLTLYGDLDCSILDEMPPGRRKIQTFVREADRLPQVIEFIRQKLSTRQQAYIVYPRVEETSGPAGIKAVVMEFEKLQRAFAPYKTGLLHGRLSHHEKEATMNAFRSGVTHVLLTTSLIEVGLDVPNATVMLIENAEQFGLAQLHQLRGRIGRGSQQSYCILVAAAKTAEARERLSVMERSNDGFEIAEADLRLRGPGEFLGQQQSGMPRFRFAEFNTDRDLIELAQRIASELAAR